MQHALEHQPVKLTVVDPGTAQTRTLLLPLDQLSAQDLEADFLTKLGLSLALSQPQLGRIMPDSPAMRAGLLEGDLITQIDTQPIADSVQLIELVRAAPNKTLHFGVLRAGQFHDIAVTPVAVEVNGVAVGKLNVEVRSAPEMLLHQDTLWLALKKASQRTWDTATLTLKMLGKMLVGEVSLKNVTGPLTIANYAGQTAQTGLISYISFLAFISISLGVMNLLPIPVLDGGHLLYYSLEVLSGRPVSARYWEVAQRLGVAMLMLLMVLAFYNDIVRLLPA